MPEPSISETKHLELIQAVVARLAVNSFSTKAWSIGLITALLSVAARTSELRFALLALLPALCFWALDAYYLWQERLFRQLYDTVRKDLLTKASPPRIEPYSMDVAPLAGEVESWAATLLAGVVIAVHGPVLVAVLAVCLLVVLNSA